MKYIRFNLWRKNKCKNNFVSIIEEWVYQRDTCIFIYLEQTNWQRPKCWNVLWIRLFFKVQIWTLTATNTNCHCGWWRRLWVQLKSANERITFHQERKKRTIEKGLVWKSKNGCWKLKKESYSLSGINK